MDTLTACFFEIHFKPLRTKLYLFNLDPVRTAQKTLSALIIKTDKLLLYREIIAVCSEINAKHIHALCGQNVEFVCVKLVVRNVSLRL